MFEEASLGLLVQGVEWATEGVEQERRGSGRYDPLSGSGRLQFGPQIFSLKKKIEGKTI